MPAERLLLLHLHDLLSYLGQQGVVTIMVMSQQGLVGSQVLAPVDTTYLADTVLLTRFFEHDAEVRRAISVIKKRTGAHERSIRELQLTSAGLDVGEPLRSFPGILGGTTLVRQSGGGLGND